ncbi:MAG TPA: hypothetical protein VFX52_00655 [Nocardioidaceae bacterium]|jgi:hypothetical protein|nr:hypothetical protein [Nocardioidaceae bacterium]
MNARTASGPRTAAAAVAAAALIGGVVAAGATPASAKGVEARSSGHCGATSTTWKLKAKADGSRIETELEVDSNRAGQLWTVSLSDNRVRVYTGTRHTTAPSGSFSVERLLANRTGRDVITADARNAVTGQTCHGTVTFPG